MEVGKGDAERGKRKEGAERVRRRKRAGGRGRKMNNFLTLF